MHGSAEATSPPSGGGSSRSPVAKAYRADIDGLRAIAVSAVVVFHAGIGAVPGGFVGVDIFFVISGYLIGGQIFQEVTAGRFSFADFYMRRARRILPALYAMLLLFLAVGTAVLTPLELKQLGKETIATILGLSNLLYYNGGGYFAPGADYNPLLMTWSLGVEEQFYVLFPFLVLGLKKFRIPALPALVAIAALSFAGSIVLLAYDRNAAFYLLPTRAWELGLGAALALWELRPRRSEPAPRWRREAAAVAGLVLLASSIAFYDSRSAFPGFFALLPTSGTALLIATPKALMNIRLLSLAALPFIGRVSYSWYLWHWPLFFLNRVLSGGKAGLSPISLIMLSLLLGILSWRFVERPFRHQVAPPKRLLLSYAIAGFALMAAPVILYRSDGWPGRFSPLIQAFAESSRTTRDNPCLAPYGTTTLQDPGGCIPPDHRGRLVLFGDSQASALASGVRSLAAASDLGFGEMTKATCLPLAGYATEVLQRPRHWQECIAYQQAALTYLDGHADIHTVVLAGSWSSAQAGLRMRGAETGAPVSLVQALDATLTRLRASGREVVLVQEVPLFGFDPYARVVGQLIPVRAAISAWLRGEPAGDFVASLAEIIPDRSAASVTTAAEGRPDVSIVDPAARLCSPAGCRFGTPDALFYMDYQHLTASGGLAALQDVRLKSAAPP